MHAKPRGTPEILPWSPGDRRLMTRRMYFVAGAQPYPATSA